MVRVVHVGCGNMSRAWLRAASAVKGLRVIGLVDLNRDLANHRAREFGLTESLVDTDLTRVVKATGPDVVFNCTTPAAHYPVTMAALKAGCHVLSEKPLANSLLQARRMIREAERRALLFAVTQNYRYTLGARHVRKLIDSGIIGELSAVHADFNVPAHFGGFREEMEHVLLHDMAIHHFDLARFFTGLTPEAVFCHEFNPPESWFRHGAAAHAIFEMENGLVFNYRGSWCAQGQAGTWNGCWRIQGARGAILWDGGQEVRVERPTGKTGVLRSSKATRHPAPSANRPERHEAIIRELVRCLRSGRTPETVAADNYHSLEMVFGAISSAKRKRRHRFH